MIELDGDPNARTTADPSCGTCEFCVREAVMANGLDHLCLLDVDGGHHLRATNPNATSGMFNHVDSHRVTFNPTMEELEMRTESCPVTEGQDSLSATSQQGSCSRPLVRVPLFVSISLMASYVLLGGFLFSRWNPRWSLLDGVFYSFKLLSTIGCSEEDLLSPFGPLLAGSSKRILMLSLYLLFGHAFLSMCIFLMQGVREKVESCFRRMNRRSKSDVSRPVEWKCPYNKTFLREQFLSPSSLDAS